MEKELELLEKRLAELAARAEQRGTAVCSAFLTTAEQAALSRLRPGPYALDGGYEGAERRVAVFLPWAGADWDSPVACLELAPAHARFAEPLGHRDCLGALMGLGLKREVLGDIVPDGGRFLLLCLASVAGYVAENLAQVRRTAVTVRRAAAPPAAAALPEAETLTAASARLDALVAAVYKLSRGESARLFEQARVLQNGLPARGPSAEAAPGDTVSVRGLGRFRLEAREGETRHGRARFRLRVWR